jgi:flagellar motor component MotA
VAPSTTAGIITAIATLTTAFGGIIAAFTLFLPILRKTKEVHKETQEVHQIVNQQHTDMLRYQRQLIRALESHGIAIPDDQSEPLPADSQPRRPGGV